jgi:hypothetical protein
MVVAHIFPNRTWQRIVSVDGGATWSSATPIGPNEEDLNQADDLMSVGTVVNGHPAFVYVFGNGTHSFLRYSRSLDVYGLSWGQPACGLDGCHINGQFNAGDEIQGDLQVTTQLSITSSTTFAATAPLVVVTGVCIINQGTILQLDIGKQSNLTAGTALPTLLCKGGIAGSFQGSLVSGSCFTSIQSEVQQTSTLSSLVIVSSSPSPQCQGGAGLTTGAIIGISVGCVVAGLAIAVAVALIWRCQQKRTAKMFRTIAIRQQAAATTSLSL